MQFNSKVIDLLVQSIVETVHPLKIILFGSAARGEISPDSNIDSLILPSYVLL